MRADTEEKRANYYRLCDALKNGEYDSYASFMEEVRNQGRKRNINNRHYGLLINKAHDYFNIPRNIG